MKKILKAYLLIFAIFFMMGGVNAETNPDIAQGITGTCGWKITSENELIIGPTLNQTNMEDTCTIENFNENINSYPWEEYSDEVFSIKINEGTKANTNSQGLFSGFRNIETVDLANLDMSNVEDISYMFAGTKNRRNEINIDLSTWNVSNVKNMEKMFYNVDVNELNLDISKWDTSKVTNMSGMFETLEGSPIIDIIGDLIIPNNCNVEEMFEGGQNVTGTFVIEGNLVYENFERTFSTMGREEIQFMYKDEIGEATIDDILSKFTEGSFTKLPYKKYSKIFTETASSITVNDKITNEFGAREQDTVKVNTESQNYMIKSISITNKRTKEKIDFNYEDNTFIMPADEVILNVTYIKKPSLKLILNKPELIDYNNIKLSWNTEDEFTEYNLQLYENDTIVNEITTSQTNYTFENLKENFSSYKIILKGYLNVDVDGVTKKISSSSYETDLLKTSKELEAPTVNAELTEYNKVKLTWNEIEDAEGYHIYYKQENSSNYVFLKETQETYYELNELTNNIKYDFKVVPVTHYYKITSDYLHTPSPYSSLYAFESKLFGTTSIQMPSLPSMKTFIIESSLYNNTKISWQDSLNPKSDFYKVYYKESTKTTYELLGQYTTTYFQTNNLKPVCKYDFKIVPYIIYNEKEVAGLEYNTQLTTSGYELAKSKITGIVSKIYNAKSQTQKINVVYGTKTLVLGTDYTISYKNNKYVGTATVTIKGKGLYTGTIIKTFKITKAKNPLTVVKYTKNVKYTNLKKSKQIVKPITVKKYQGKLSYKKISGSKKLVLNKTTGKITVKKGTKKGTYKMKVKVSANGNSNYKAGYKIITITVRVK